MLPVFLSASSLPAAIFACGFSCFRIILSPWVFLFFAQAREKELIFLLAMALISDFLDGWIARTFRGVTAFGALLDPIADKIFLGTFAVSCLCYPPKAMPLVYPSWFFFAASFLLRDVLLLLGGFVLVSLKKKTPSVCLISKWHTCLQAGFFGILMAYPFFQKEISIVQFKIITFGFFLSIVFTGWLSFFIYVFRSFFK